MFKERIVELKNSKKVRLFLTQNEESYILAAMDENNKFVGECNFNISFIFSRPYSDEEMAQIYEREFKRIGQLGVDAYKQSGDIKCLDLKQIENEDFNIQGHTLILNNKKYTFKSSNLECLWLEIVDERFIHTGLGKVLWFAMEEIAKNYKCENIHGRVQPFGKFSDSTLSFYDLVGFIREFDPCDRKVYGKKILNYSEEEKSGSKTLKISDLFYKSKNTSNIKKSKNTSNINKNSSITPEQ